MPCQMEQPVAFSRPSLHSTAPPGQGRCLYLPMTGRELQYRSDCKLYHTGVTDILPVAVEENTIRTDSQAILRKIKPPKAFAALYAGASFTACAVHNGLGYPTYSADRQCARKFTLSVAQKVFADRDLAKTWFFFVQKIIFWFSFCGIFAPVRKR